MKEDITQRLHIEYYKCEECGHKTNELDLVDTCPKCGSLILPHHSWQELLE